MITTAAEDLYLRMRILGAAGAKVELDGVAQAVDRTDRAAGRAHKSTTMLGRAFGGLRSVIGTVMGITGIAGMAFGLGEAIKKAQAFQAVTAQLGASIRANIIGNASEAQKRLTDFAESFSTKGGFDPVTEIRAMTQLTRQVHNTSRVMQDMTLATNIARGSHKDLAIATRAVSMVEAGRLTMLTRLGIVLPKGTKAQQAYAILLQRYAGATDAYNKTAAGAMSNFEHALDLVGEKIGKLLIPYLTIAFKWLSHFIDQLVHGVGPGKTFHEILQRIGTILKTVVSSVKDAVKWIEGFVDAFKRGHTWAVALAAGLAALVAVGIVAWVVGIVVAVKEWVAAQWLLNAALDANPIGIVILALAAFAGAMVVLYMKVKVVRDVINAVWSWLKGATVDVIGFVVDHWKMFATVLAGVMLGPFAAVAVMIITHFNAVKSAVVDIINWIIRMYNGIPLIHGFTVLGVHVGGLPKIHEIGTGSSKPATAAPNMRQRGLNYSTAGHQGAPAYRSVYTPKTPSTFQAVGGAITAGGQHIFEGTIINQMDGREVGRSLVRVGATEKARQ